MAERSVTVRLRGDISDFNRKMLEAAAGAKAFTHELDTSTDRVANLTQSILALGPALIPISTVAVPAMAGLANQLGVGAAAVGVAVLAFKGLGKALDAVNDYQLEPTEANLQKVQDTLGQLGPAGQDFVLFLQRARPELQHLQELSRAGLFPGIEEGLTSLTGILPDVERIITTVSTTLGELSADAGSNLNSPEWHEFFDFLNQEARPTLLAMGKTAGNFAEGLAHLWMAFAPLENNFSQGFLGLARDFNTWADGLDKTEKFQEFLAYVDKEGPAAWDTLGALANALLQIVEAAAPVGAATLPVIKAISNAIADIADSDLGPVIIGVVSLTSAYSRLIALGRTANTGVLGGRLTKGFGSAVGAAKDLPAATSAYFDYGRALGKADEGAGKFGSTQERLRASLGGTAKLMAGGAGLAFVMSGYADKVHLANTATLALAGSMFGPEGAAIGGTIGLIKDLSAQHDNLSAAIAKTQAATDTGTLSLDQQAAALEKLRPTIDALRGAHGLAGDAVKDDIAAYDQLQSSYEANVRTAQDAQFAEAGLTQQMAGASKATRDETAALLDNIKAKNAAADATETAFSAETAYRKALKDAEKQARTNNAGINGSSDAALANRDALDQLATAWNKVADAGGKTNKDLKNARTNFIRVAEGMGLSRAAARALADSLLHIPSPNPKITVSGAAEAKRTITVIKNLIAGVHGKTVSVTVIRNTKSGSTITGGGRTGSAKADGGEINGPGGPRDDLIPILASNKEIMVNARDAQEHRDFLLALNAGRFRGLKPQFYADGGEVGVGRMQRMAPNGYLGPAALSGTSAPTSFTADLAGAEIAVGQDGLMRFVKGQIQISNLETEQGLVLS